jgi:hypothetical protein
MAMTTLTYMIQAHTFIMVALRCSDTIKLSAAAACSECRNVLQSC